MKQIRTSKVLRQVVRRRVVNGDTKVVQSGIVLEVVGQVGCHVEYVPNTAAK